MLGHFNDTVVVDEYNVIYITVIKNFEIKNNLWSYVDLETFLLLRWSNTIKRE